MLIQGRDLKIYYCKSKRYDEVVVLIYSSIIALLPIKSIFEIRCIPSISLITTRTILKLLLLCLIGWWYLIDILSKFYLI